MKKPHLRYTLSTIALIGFLGACAAASTNISTLAAPELAGRRMRAILVVAAFDDIGLRRATEEEFAMRGGAGVTFVPSYRIFFPGRTYAAPEVSAALSEHAIEATLVIEPRAAGQESQYVPPTYVTTCSSGWTPQGGCTQVTTSPTSAGISITKAWTMTSAMLFDARTAQSVWVASGFTGGNAFATSRTLLVSMVQRVSESLESDQVTDWRGCLLSDRADRIARYEAQVAQEGRVNYLRSQQTLPNMPYPVMASAEARARTDSTNAAIEAQRQAAAQQASTLPSPWEVQFAKRASAGLRSCQGPAPAV